ncbi:G-box-binding factor 4 [Vitis vinifera]|uniref:G-box-binding factor 4 n=1 Tax=Vitis vinifera TaxID=29760 RepID=A0A438EMI7_VITVI|nr:G-box-binding factor 4 [Vitis vinifera]
MEIVGGRGKRRAPVLEPLDKAAQQKQRRMIKNRESAARSRERKQAYQVELESSAVRLEEENEQLLKEKIGMDDHVCYDWNG